MHQFDDDEDGNGTSLFDLLKGNPLHEVSGYWVFNESDISKYEDVDLSKLFRKFDIKTLIPFSEINNSKRIEL